MTEAANETLMALERAVLDRWSQGDPYGYVENAADDVTWFDHVTEERVDGLEALEEHVRQFVGMVDIPRYEMPNPSFHSYDDVAVLSFNWHTYSDEGELTSRWNATEVYRRIDDQWKYVHMHWAPIVTEA